MVYPEALFVLKKKGNTPVEELALAVVRQAMEDYREYRILHRMYPHNDYVRKQFEELEEFFRSEWFDTLICSRNISGAWVMKEIGKENT